MYNSIFLMGGGILNPSFDKKNQKKMKENMNRYESKN